MLTPRVTNTVTAWSLKSEYEHDIPIGTIPQERLRHDGLHASTRVPAEA